MLADVWNDLKIVRVTDVTVGLGRCNGTKASVVATVVKWLQPNDAIWCFVKYIVFGKDWVPNGHQAITWM